MHVVQALVSLNLGGSELVAVELCEFLTSRGHRSTVVCSDGPLAGRVLDCGAQLLDWPIGKKRLGTLRYIAKLQEWLADERPDVLHVHSRLPAWICFLAMRGLEAAQKPVFITSMHGHYSVSRYSAIMASGDRVIAVSDHIREYTLHNYLTTDPGRVVTVHGGINREAFPRGYQAPRAWREQTLLEFPGLRNRRLICLPGRLSRYKGHVDFIELIAKLAPAVPEIHGVVVGEARVGSRYRDELEGLAERYGVLDRLTFTGARTDIRDWMSIAEIVYSLCSDPPEAFGRTVPEALHLGIPVIAWDHGGVRETLAALFPEGAVTPGNRHELLMRSQDFLELRPEVPFRQAFGLRESMEKTFAVYQSALEDKAP